MTLTQLEYIVSLADCGSFSEAANRCFVTQPTLSMQIQKLEDEWDLVLFDRSAHPVLPTSEGLAVITKARQLLSQSNEIQSFIKNRKGKIEGELNIGIIPTLAPYLLPLFLKSILKSYPLLKLRITEFTTDEIIKRLKEQRLDCGILATPLEEAGIQEQVLFYEPFVAYVSDKSDLYKKNTLTAKDINPDETWILNEGHCLRNQVLNWCKIKSDQGINQLHYESGSIETLKRMVDSDGGITILPQLAVKLFTAKELNRVRYFQSPEPVREISLITHRYFIKQNLLQVLQDEIQKVIPEKMKSKKKMKVINI